MYSHTFGNFERNPETKKIEKTGEVTYTVKEAVPFLIFGDGTNEKRVRVRNNETYIVKWNEKSKTFSAIGGASGLYDFFSTGDHDHAYLMKAAKLVLN